MTETPTTDLGRLLESARGGRTIGELLDAAEISRSYYQAIVRGYKVGAGGKHKPVGQVSRDVVFRLAKAFGVPERRALWAAGHVDLARVWEPRKAGARTLALLDRAMRHAELSEESVAQVLALLDELDERLPDERSDGRSEIAEDGSSSESGVA